MNARQKAKIYKKKLQDLYEDYVTSATVYENALDLADKQITLTREQQVVLRNGIAFNSPREVDEKLATAMIEGFIFNDQFRQAVVFEGYIDPDTGKYILDAKLTVVMPELEEGELE